MVYFCLLFLKVLTLFNPYLDQLCAQTGLTLTEARRELLLTVNPVTDEVARERGYDTANEYLEALYEFLNSN